MEKGTSDFAAASGTTLKMCGQQVSEDSSVLSLSLTHTHTHTHSENLRCDLHSPKYVTSVHTLSQRFSNFFQVGTTFISQNVLRTTLLLGLSNSLGLP